MSLLEKLSARRRDVLRRWCGLVYATYPEDTARFLASQSDRFANPVGWAIRNTLSKVIDGVLGETDEGELRSALDDLIRIRNVQDFTSWGAVAFLPLMREALFEVLDLDASEREEAWELVESLLAVAVEILVACREKLYEVRARELVARQASLIRRAEKLLGESSEDSTVFGGGRSE